MRNSTQVAFLGRCVPWYISNAVYQVSTTPGTCERPFPCLHSCVEARSANHSINGFRGSHDYSQLQASWVFMWQKQHARSVVEICKATCAPGLHLLVLGLYYTSRVVAGMFRSSFRSCGCAASQSSSFKRNRLWQRAVVICQASRILQDLQQTEQEYIK